MDLIVFLVIAGTLLVMFYVWLKAPEEDARKKRLKDLGMFQHSASSLGRHNYYEAQRKKAARKAARRR